MCKRRRFTLVELMVVIAVIGILISLLLPSLKNARESTKSAVCKSNERQFSNLFYNYIELEIAPGNTYGLGGVFLKQSGQLYSWNYWRREVARQNELDMGKLFNDLSCPNSDSSWSYANNAEINRNNILPELPYLDQIANTSEVVQLGEPRDVLYNLYITLAAVNRTNDYRHMYGKNTSNALFLDGHVEAVTWAAIASTVSRPYLTFTLN